VVDTKPDEVLLVPTGVPTAARLFWLLCGIQLTGLESTVKESLRGSCALLKQKHSDGTRPEDQSLRNTQIQASLLNLKKTRGA
jgi:hypothetical protein